MAINGLKKGRPNRNSDVMRGRSHRSLSHGQGCWLRGAGENMEGVMGFYSTARSEGARDQCYSPTIGMEGATKGWTELGKGSQGRLASSAAICGEAV